MPCGNLHAELRRWYFSVFVLMPLLIGPSLVWKLRRLHDLERAAETATERTQGAIERSFFGVAESALVAALILLCLLLWHWPALASSGRSICLWTTGRKAFPTFVVVLAGLSGLLAWKEVEHANCLYEFGLSTPDPTMQFGFWGEPCRFPPLGVLAAYVIMGLNAVLLLRALIMWRVYRSTPVIIERS